MKEIFLSLLSLATLSISHAQTQNTQDGIQEKAELIDKFNKSCKESMIQAGLEEDKYMKACDCIAQKVNETMTLEQLKSFSFDSLDKADVVIQTTIQQFAMECVAPQ